MMIRALTIGFILIIGGCASPQQSDYKRFQKSAELTPSASTEKPLEVLFVAPGPLDVRGVYDPNDNIDANSMMYAADAGAAGLLAQVLVHAAISSSAQDKKLAEQQKQANKVLEPVSDLIGQMNTEVLVHSSEHYRFAGEATDENAIIVQSQPIFFVSQDLTTVSVRNLIEVKTVAPSSPKKRKSKTKPVPGYSNLIEVIGQPVDKDAALALYRKGDGESLRAIFADLYKQSLELMHADFRGTYTNAAQQHSFKFTNGEQPRFERGSELNAECERKVIRNLRGWVISYAHKPEGDACADGGTSSL